MRNALFLLFIFSTCMFFTDAQAQNIPRTSAPAESHNQKLFERRFRVVTTVESVAPGGIGRSRMMIDAPAPKIEEDTTETKPNHHGSSLKSEKEEVKMKNFYSMTGINFKNIAANDVQITKMLDKMIEKGWKLYKVVSGMDGGTEGGSGLFITRYIFVRIIPNNRDSENTH